MREVLLRLLRLHALMVQTERTVFAGCLALWFCMARVLVQRITRKGKA